MVALILAMAVIGAEDGPYVFGMPWEPGDKAVAFGYTEEGQVGLILGLDGESAPEEVGKAVDADDKAGIARMVEEGTVTLLDSGTRVVVLEMAPDKNPAGGPHAWKVRVQDGAHAGKSLFVMGTHLRPPVTVFGEGVAAPKPGAKGYAEAIAASDRLIYKEVMTAIAAELAKMPTEVGTKAHREEMDVRRLARHLDVATKKYQRPIKEALMIWDKGNKFSWPWDRPDLRPGVMPEINRAAGQIRIAKSLEKTNRTAAAKQFRSIVRDYPGTPEAKEAAAWLKANDKVAAPRKAG